MIWSSWSEFFAMGGYGVYVWGSYLVTFACIIGEMILISKRRRTLVKRYGLIHDSDAEEIPDKKEIKNTDNALNINEISDSKTKEISNKEEIKNETTS